MQIQHGETGRRTTWPKDMDVPTGYYVCAHHHVNAQDGTDRCAECGRDLRDEVHIANIVLCLKDGRKQP